MKSFYKAENLLVNMNLWSICRPTPNLGLQSVSILDKDRTTICLTLSAKNLRKIKAQKDLLYSKELYNREVFKKWVILRSLTMILTITNLKEGKRSMSTPISSYVLTTLQLKTQKCLRNSSISSLKTNKRRILANPKKTAKL